MYTWHSSPEYDLQIDMIDANPASPTFNSVLATFFGQLNTFTVIPFSGTATPDGKYVYVNFEDIGGSGFHIAIFDVVHGGPATVIDPETVEADLNRDTGKKCMCVRVLSRSDGTGWRVSPIMEGFAASSPDTQGTSPWHPPRATLRRLSRQ